METKDIVKALGPMGEMFDVITERGVLSALYLAALALPVVISARTTLNLAPNLAAQDYLWISGTSIILGLIISKVTYEFLLNAVRPLTEPVVLTAFHEVVGSTEILPRYADFRKFRETFLATDGPAGRDYLKGRILKDEALRHTITYLMCSNLFALPVLVALLLFPDFLGAPRSLLTLELCVVVYVLIATYFAEKSRSAALGRAVGYAYLQAAGHKGVRE